MSFMKEFREFAVKGNVVDLAVGVIIGAAFGKIIDSIVKDVVMPVVNALLGGAADFSNQYLRARIETEKPAVPAAPPEDVVLLREIRDELKRR